MVLKEKHKQQITTRKRLYFLVRIDFIMSLCCLFFKPSANKACKTNNANHPLYSIYHSLRCALKGFNDIILSCHDYSGLTVTNRGRGVGLLSHPSSLFRSNIQKKVNIKTY